MPEPKNPLNDILIQARKNKASDVHISAQNHLTFRQFGQLERMTVAPLNKDQTRGLITSALPLEVIRNFEKTGDAEFVHTVNGYGRFRMTLMKQRNGWDLTARLIPMDIPTLDDTGMPASCTELTKWSQGMVLISGPAGCGKTTSLATLVELINQNRTEHIISIEQPIEIIYQPKKCQITQREVGIHTSSQSSALQAALREDPDILIISELRNLSTIQLAINAAETGHLVFGTMNTVNAAQTVSQLIDSFPGEDQSNISNMLSESLRGVICQQLIPKKDGSGMVCAFEVMIVNASISYLIRELKFGQINNAISTGKSAGMVLMDNSLEYLAKTNVISKEDACARAMNPQAMVKILKEKTRA